MGWNRLFELGYGVPDKGSGSSFSPTDITGLMLWLDANDLTTLWQDSGRTTPVALNNDPVGAWDDKSGSGYNNTQSVAGSRPTYLTSTFGSLAGIDFDGTADFLANSSLSVAQPDTIFVVVKPDATGQDAKMIDDDNTVGGNTRQAVYLQAAGSLTVVFAGTPEVTGGA